IQIKDIDIAGKTETAENFTKVDGKRAQLTDHSILVAIATVENQNNAIAVFVEKGYWESRWVGRIAGLMIDRYSQGDVTDKAMENYVLNGSLEEEYAKPLSGKPCRINE